MKTLYFIAFSLSSIYIFPSGTPQPADLLFVAVSFIVLFSYLFYSEKILIFLSDPTIYLSIFVGWALLVSIFWTLSTQDPSFLKYILFYLFNLIVSFALLIYLRSYVSAEKYILYSLYTALIISGIGVLISVGASIRPKGFFNNPNQLAFYSLLVWSSILVITQGRAQKSLLYWAAFLSCLMGIFAAASLAAMAGYLLLLLVMLIRNVVLSRMASLTVGFLVVCVVIYILFPDVALEVFSNVESRLNRADAKIDDVYTERNYDRIFAFPHFMILGAAEGGFERFYPHDSLEIHSTPGMLIFSYGLIGLISVFLAWFNTLKKTPVYVWLITAAPMVYSLSHMGLRTTMFWLLLIFIWHKHGGKYNSILQANKLK